MFPFDPDKFLTDQQLGQGSFGRVCPYRSRNDPTGKQSVVKEQTVDFQGLRLAVQEIALGFDCKHPNILSINGFDIKRLPKPLPIHGKSVEYEVYIKMPRMDKSLKNVITRQEVTSEGQILNYFRGISSGLAYLHEKGIAHRDIKPENILLDEKDVVKIADIGIAKYLDNVSATHVASTAGTPNYMAPEVVIKGSKLKKDELCIADLWSLGVTVLELCLIKQVRAAAFGFPKRTEYLINLVMSLKGKYSDFLIDLLLSLLQYEPLQRIKIDKLVEKLEELPFDLLTVQDIKKTIDEEFGENMLVRTDSQSKRRPGEVRMEELETVDGSILSVREQLRTSYGGFFIIEANETDRALTIRAQKKEEITDIRLEGLFRSLIEEIQNQNYTKLRDLWIDMKGCHQITDSGFRKLTSQVTSNLTSLVQLQLEFSGCDQVTDSALRDLAAQIEQNLKSLWQLRLCFSPLTEQVEQSLRETLKDIPSLQFE